MWSMLEWRKDTSLYKVMIRSYRGFPYLFIIHIKYFRRRGNKSSDRTVLAQFHLEATVQLIILFKSSYNLYVIILGRIMLQSIISFFPFLLSTMSHPSPPLFCPVLNSPNPLLFVHRCDSSVLPPV